MSRAEIVSSRIVSRVSSLLKNRRGHSDLDKLALGDSFHSSACFSLRFFVHLRCRTLTKELRTRFWRSVHRLRIFACPEWTTRPTV